MEQERTKDLRGYALGLEFLSLQAAIAPRNRTFANSIVPGANQTAPTDVVVLAGIIQPRISGVFRVDVSTSFVGTGNFFLDLQVFTSAAAFPANLVNGTETAVGSNVFYLGADAGGVAANGLTFGGAVGTSLYSADVTCSAAEALSVHNGTIFDVGAFPFTSQQYVAFALEVTSAANFTVPQFTISIWEQA